MAERKEHIGTATVSTSVFSCRSTEGGAGADSILDWIHVTKQDGPGAGGRSYNPNVYDRTEAEEGAWKNSANESMYMLWYTVSSSFIYIINALMFMPLARSSREVTHGRQTAQQRRPRSLRKGQGYDGPRILLLLITEKKRGEYMYYVVRLQ